MSLEHVTSEHEQDLILRIVLDMQVLVIRGGAGNQIRARMGIRSRRASHGTATALQSYCDHDRAWPVRDGQWLGYSKDD